MDCPALVSFLATPSDTATVLMAPLRYFFVVCIRFDTLPYPYRSLIVHSCTNTHSEQYFPFRVTVYLPYCYCTPTVILARSLSQMGTDILIPEPPTCLPPTSLPSGSTAPASPTSAMEVRHLPVLVLHPDPDQSFANAPTLTLTRQNLQTAKC